MEELLFLTHRIPFPPNKGDKIRSFNMLKYLTRSYRVHLGTFVDDPDDWRHVPAVQSMCAETCFIGLRPLWAKLRSVRAFVSGEPQSLPYYRDARLQSWVNRILQSGALRRVLVFSSPMAQYVARVDPGVRRVIDFVDMDSDKWEQYSRKHVWPISWLYRREGRALFSFERTTACAFDKSIFVSQAEADLFKQHAPETAAHVTNIDNGVDTDYFSPQRDYPNPYLKDEQHLVFTGAMDYQANVDAVDWFARQVFPLIRARLPPARFTIVGSRPTRAVQSLSGLPGVSVTGAVPDIRPYLAHAHAAVAPLRIARGVQNKVLEAMAMARPVLATPMAMDGIKFCPGLESLVAHAPEEIARQAVELLSAKDVSVFGRRGRECVLQNYNWNENLRHLESILENETPSTTGLTRAHGKLG